MPAAANAAPSACTRGLRTTYRCHAGRAAGHGGRAARRASRGPPPRTCAPARAAPVGPLVEVRQLHAQDRGLQRVEARVVADELVASTLSREPWKRSIRTRSAIARIRRSRSCRRRRSSRGSWTGRTRTSRPSPSAPGRPPRHASPPPGRRPRAPARRAPRSRAPARRCRTGATATTAFVRGRQRRAHRLGRHAHRVRVDVAEHRAGPGGRDRLGARVERERRHDHLVARSRRPSRAGRS